MIYAFVDANIYVRVLSQGKPGCEPGLFADLQTLASGGAVRLLVPDVVRFEIDKQMRDLPSQLRTRFGELKATVNKTSVWSEITDAKEAVLRQLDTLRESKESGWQKRFEMVDKLLGSESVTRLPYTPEVMCRARIRLMRGAKPHKDQDAAIVESLALFFEGASDAKPVLLFCSENHTDFALELDSSSDRNRRFAIDPEIARVLPQTHYFLTLDSLLQINKGYESLPKPPEDSEITQALGRMSELEDEGYDDSDEYLAAMTEVEAFYDKKLSQDFMAKVLPSLPKELQARRDDVSTHIETMLQDCRRCASWDEIKSESKLPQWLEYVPEHMIRFTSLAKMLRIEASVHRYLRIHRSMDQTEVEKPSGETEQGGGHVR